MAGPNRVTIEEIGKRLNVSTSTVSRALRQDPLIHPQTRARVNALAMDLGYQGRSRKGRSRAKKSCSIAVLFSSASLAQVRGGAITTSYLEGLTAEAEGADVQLNVHTVSPQKKSDFEETAGIPRGLWSGDRDAAIVIGHQHMETVTMLAQRMPVVSLVWEYPGVPHDLVNTPDMSGMDFIIQHLAELGHRRMVWAGSPFRGGSFVQSRKAGFVAACLRHGIPLEELSYLEEDLFSDVSDTQVAKPELLVNAVRNGATAFICASDHAGEMVMNSLQASGIKVPKEVSVTGFDAVAKRPDGTNVLTSIDPQFVEMGRTALRLAKWRLAQPSSAPITLTLRAKPVVGMSTAKAPGRRGNN